MSDFSFICEFTYFELELIKLDLLIMGLRNLVNEKHIKVVAKVKSERLGQLLVMKTYSKLIQSVSHLSYISRSITSKELKQKQYIDSKAFTICQTACIVGRSNL
jgi:hypothetical protein